MGTRLGLIASVAVATLATPSLAAEKFIWNIAVYGPPREVTVGIEHIAKMAAEKSGGNFQFKIHYGEAIASAKEVLDSHKIEAIQGALTAFSYAPGKTQLQQVLDLPWLPLPTLDAQIAVQDATQLHPAVQAELARWNAFSLVSIPLPQYEFMGVGAPPHKLEDWAGRRVRALGGLGDAMKLLGAVPTSVPAPEVYQALERGTFDAASFPFSYSFGVYRLHEVSKWFTTGMQLGVVHNSLTISKSAYDKLPAEYKKILEDAKPEHYRVMKEGYAKADAKWLPIFRAKMTEVHFTPEMLAEVQRIAAKPVWEKWAAETDAKGLPGTELLNFVLNEAKKVAGS